MAEICHFKVVMPSFGIYFKNHAPLYRYRGDICALSTVYPLKYRYRGAWFLNRQVKLYLFSIFKVNMHKYLYYIWRNRLKVHICEIRINMCISYAYRTSISILIHIHIHTHMYIHICAYVYICTYMYILTHI